MKMPSGKCQEQLEEALYVQNMAKVLYQTVPRGGMPLDFVLEKIDNLDMRIEKSVSKGLIDHESAQALQGKLSVLRIDVIDSTDGEKSPPIAEHARELKDAGLVLVFNTAKACPD